MSGALALSKGRNTCKYLMVTFRVISGKQLTYYNAIGHAAADFVVIFAIQLLLLHIPKALARVALLHKFQPYPFSCKALIRSVIIIIIIIIIINGMAVTGGSGKATAVAIVAKQ